MILSPEQQIAYDRTCAFLKAKHVDQRHLVIEGLGGTGKSTLLAEVARRFSQAALCALFGKAAHNLAQKTGLPVKTLHSTIYNYCGKNEYDDPMFTQKVDDGDWHGKIVILDEHGVVDEYVGRDLMATGCRVVAAGDPGQLPPVKGHPYFTACDIELKTVHRQAWDSPIIRQAHQIRHTGRYDADTADFRVSSTCTHDDVMQADILLCWRNTTRRQLNHLKRAYIGYVGTLPRAGEPVMCLRNDHQAGVLNGGIYTLLRNHEPSCGKIWVINDRNEEICLREAWIEDFDNPRADTDEDKHHPFAMAYCCTVHKAQGSEWPNVLIVDEMYADRPEYINWLYTAVTRASKRVLMKI